MIRNYLKVAFRSIFRNKLTAFINIAGLALAMTCAVMKLANVAPPIGPLLKSDFGEVEVMARAINFGFVIGLEENSELKKVFNEDYLFVAEPSLDNRRDANH